jgi:hypothetical protein
VFFVVHAGTTLLLPTRITSAWIDWSPGAGGSWPWLPLVILVGEAAVAGLLAIGLPALPRLVPAGRREEFVSRGRSIRTTVVTWVLRTLRAGWLHRAAWAVAGLLAVASVTVTLVTTPDATRTIWTGLRGYASLGAMLCCWLVIFWLATHAAIGHGARTLREQQAAVAAVCGLVALHVLSAPAWLVAPLAAVAAVFSGSRTLAALWQGVPYGTLRATCGIGLAVAAAVSLAASRGSEGFPIVAAVWLGLALLSLGSTTLGWIATRKPAALYPLTVLLGYFAFAIPYSALGEARQSAMPAAGSIAIAFALVAAVATSVVLARPKSALLSLVALVAVAVLLNGAVLFMTPNEFKGSFPNMGPYYGLPVYLDSRDYFRDTTPSTAQLRSRAVTEDFDRLSRQGSSERLATVYFTMGPLRDRPDGSHAVSLTVEDPRGRLRAVVGDALRLTAEEWFTIRVDGDDLVALAEEPFYRRIFRWFRYETLHTVRHGIIRGAGHVLVPADEAGRRHARRSPVPYQFITGRGGPDGPASDELLGLRVEGLAADYEALGGEYAIISMHWRGVVTAARHHRDRDEYTVEFEVPEHGARLDESQLRTMQSWLERCHLDTLRPAVPVIPGDAEGPPHSRGMVDARDRVGECLVLEDARTEAAVPVGVFFAAPPEPDGLDPAFAAYLPSREAIEATIRATPPPVPSREPADAVAADDFTLRPAHDRERVEQRDARPRIEPEQDEQRDERRPQEAGDLHEQDRTPVGGGQAPLVAPIECERRGPAEGPLAHRRMDERERCEQEPQEDDARKRDHRHGVRREAGRIAPFHHVRDVFRILGRAIEALAVVVTMVAGEERARHERHDAREGVPRRLERRHLVLAEVAHLVDERPEPVEPEGRDRKGDELRPRPERGGEIEARGGVGGHEADDEVGPVPPRRDAEEIGVGLADGPPDVADPLRVLRLAVRSRSLRGDGRPATRLHADRLLRNPSPRALHQRTTDSASPTANRPGPETSGAPRLGHPTIKPGSRE